MDAVSIRTTLAASDWTALCRAVAARVDGPDAARRVALRLLGWTLLGVALMAVTRRFDWQLHVPSLALGAGALLLGILLNVRSSRRRYVPDADGMVLGPTEYTISAAGIRAVRTHGESVSHWAGVREITRTDEYFYVWLDRIGALQLPLRDLPAECTPDVLHARMEAWAAAARASAATDGRAAALNAGVTDGGSAAPFAPAPGEVVPTRAANQGRMRPGGSLLAAARLYGLVGTWTGPRIPDQVGIVALAALAVALWIGLDRVSAGGSAEFVYELGAASVAWYALAGLLLAWVVTRTSEPPAAFRVAAWSVAAIAPLVVAGRWSAAQLVADRWSLAVHAGTIALALLLLVRALRMMTGALQPRAAAACLLVALVGTQLTQNVYVSDSMWYAEESADDAAGGDVRDDIRDAERLMFDQQRRLDVALAGVAASQPGTPAAYFVGFAGFGEQRVFAAEIGLAARVVGERYGSTPRTLLLVNDRRDVETHPVASATTLRHALRGVAAKMDRENDVLFLVLSSHGSEAPELSVTNGFLPLNPLDGETLADALRESGIRWKVVIVSACHAGAFIPLLRDAGTIVLTAAAADRTSFGCSDERELTYFGEALFRDALPQAQDLRAAFTSATQALAKRERAEGIEASMPQAEYSEALLARLAALERGARGTATSTAAVTARARAANVSSP